MTEAERPAKDPQELERLLIERQHAGNVEGMVALYEDDAVIHSGEGDPIKGKEAIRTFFEAYVRSGAKFSIGTQSPAIVCGDLALTSTLLPNGTKTAELARQQSDGRWLWVIDKFSN